MKTNQEMFDELKEFIASVNNNPAELIAILHRAQSIFGYLPIKVQTFIANELSINLSKVYGVVTFYSFFSLKPKGRVVIGVCLGTACYVKGSQQVIDKFCEILKIKPGETTEDGEFTIDALRCIGACGVAPAVSINGTVYPKVSVSDVQKIINHYKGE